MTIHYLTRAEKPEPLDIETALERDLKKSIVESRARKAAEAAKESDRARWLREVAQSVRDERANVEKKRAALAEEIAKPDPFRLVSRLYDRIERLGDLIEAQDRLNLSLTEHFTITNGRK